MNTYKHGDEWELEDEEMDRRMYKASENIIYVVRFDFSIERVESQYPEYEWAGECIGWYDTLEEAEHCSKLLVIDELEKEVYND